MKRLILIVLLAIGSFAFYLWIKRSVPYKEKMQTQRISIDSTNITGPVVWLYDRSSHQSFWLKTYTTIDAEEFDTLKGRTARIHFMKVFAGPFENRIFKIEIGSVVIFDQVEEATKDAGSHDL